MDAKISGVIPRLFFAFMSAPSLINRAAKSVFPLKATPISAVFPEPSVASTSALYSSNFQQYLSCQNRMQKLKV